MRLTLEQASFAYEGPRGEKNPALVDVSLEVAGGVLGLMGQTGSGKTTLLELMAGAIAPDSGCVLVDGLDVAGTAGGAGGRVAARAGVRARRSAAAGPFESSVGLVFQLPERQFFETTVEGELTFALRARGASAREARERAAEALAMMGLDLDELGGRSPFSLSGGQQRRVAIASVLAARPALLLLDEPTAGLDPRSRRACLDAVRAGSESGATVVVASHDANALVEVADRLAVLEKGRVTLDGPARELLGDAELMRAHGLEPPCAARATLALRRAGIRVPGSPLTASELAAALAGGERA